MKSDCEHVWVLNGAMKVCLWCGLPKTRSSAPVPKLKIPRAPVDWPKRKGRK